MTVRVNKPSLNIREKLSELERPIGLKGGEIMGAETAQEARDFVSAGRKNLVINGAMQVAQRGTSATNIGVTVEYNTVDRWRFADSQNPSARFTQTQSTDAPEGFGFSHKFEVTTTTTSVTADQMQYTDQFIEAQDLRSLAYGTSNAKKITLSFWVKSSVAQTFGLGLSHEDGGGSYGVSYTVNSANTWEYKTITFNGNTSTAINNDNGRGLRVRFGLSAGSNNVNGFDATSWSGSVFGQHDNGWLSISGATWQITGVQLEVGKNATEFEHRSYGEELALCQRYFFVFNNGRIITTSNSNAIIAGSIFYPATMRTNPSITFYGGNSTTGTVRFYSAGSGSQLNYDTTADNLSTAFNSLNVLGFNSNNISIPNGYSAWADLGTGTNNLKITGSAEL